MGGLVRTPDKSIAQILATMPEDPRFNDDKARTFRTNNKMRKAFKDATKYEQDNKAARAGSKRSRQEIEKNIAKGEAIKERIKSICPTRRDDCIVEHFSQTWGDVCNSV